MAGIFDTGIFDTGIYDTNAEVCLFDSGIFDIGIFDHCTYLDGDTLVVQQGGSSRKKRFKLRYLEPLPPEPEPPAKKTRRKPKRLPVQVVPEPAPLLVVVPPRVEPMPRPDYESEIADLARQIVASVKEDRERAEAERQEAQRIAAEARRIAAEREAARQRWIDEQNRIAIDLLIALDADEESQILELASLAVVSRYGELRP